MKKLKKLSRENLKSVKGGRDFCQPGKNDICGQWGLECGFHYTVQNGQIVDSLTHYACM